MVLGHSFPDAGAGISNFGALWCRTYLYTFHMALFFFLSGFVSSNRLLEGNYSVAGETKKKALRLLVPYILYSLVTLLPKLLLSQFARHPFQVSQITYIFLGKSPNGGVWFLWTLFVISLIYLALGKLFAGWSCKVYGMLVVGVVLYLIWTTGILPDDDAFEVIGYVLKFCVFYAIGVCTAKYYRKIKKYLKTMIVPVCIMAGLLIANPDIWNEKMYVLTALIGIYAFYTAAYKASLKTGCINDLLDELGTYSYDIYLLCYFVQIPIRIVCYQILGLNYWLVVFMMFGCSMVFPYIVSKRLIRGNKWLERLLVGRWK